MVGTYIHDDDEESDAYLYLDEKNKLLTTHIVSVSKFVSIYKQELTILEKMGRMRRMREIMTKAKMEWMNTRDRNIIKKIEDANLE
tara:strand:- start:224 stop:481 length:258 start_codon:yes stop_codon:yes gene_type:complete